MTKPARLYVTDPVLAEYKQLLARPSFKIRKALQQQLFQLLVNRSFSVKPTRSIYVAEDPDDNKFIECADAARADYLITGNTRHFPKFWKQTKIITSRDFLEIVAPHLLG